MRVIAALMISSGLTACTAPGLGSLARPVSEAELCRELVGPVDDLAGALRGHPETPSSVGTAAVEVVVTVDGGCEWGSALR